jgi:hypothetical protein
MEAGLLHDTILQVFKGSLPSWLYTYRFFFNLYMCFITTALQVVIMTYCIHNVMLDEFLDYIDVRNTSDLAYQLVLLTWF